MDAPFGSWATQTFIAGVSTETVIAPWVTKAAMDGGAFAARVGPVLAAEPERDTVGMPGTLASHKIAAAARAMRDAG